MQPAYTIHKLPNPEFLFPRRFCVVQFGHTKHVPLESAVGAPRATVDPAMYIPPALRHGCAGWYPEVGKAWEAWDARVRSKPNAKY